MTLTIEEIMENGIYFHSLGETHSYVSCCLADGLEQLGVPIMSNIDYYEPTYSEHRFSGSTTGAGGASAIAILDLKHAPVQILQPLELGSSHSRALILSMHDSNADFYVNSPSPMLCCHDNGFYRLPGTRRSWAFGLSTRIIEDAERLQGQKRVAKVLRNFRPSSSQSVREALDLVLLPHLEQHFEIDYRAEDEGHFSAGHLERLSSYMGCLAYGGAFKTDLIKNPYFDDIDIYRSFYGAIEFEQDPVIVRWDSWRFWESLVAGCPTFQLDLEKYGFQLPVMPEKNVHYVAVSFDNAAQEIEDAVKSKEWLLEVGRQGRKWVLEHYSPKAVAQRLINQIVQGEIVI